MSKIVRLMQRATQASPHEWWTRSSQLAYGLRNYLSFCAGGSVLSLHGHRRSLGVRKGGFCEWWSRRRTQWFVDQERIGQLCSANDAAESEVAWILERAESVLRDQIPLFSYGDVEYVGANRWHRDFIVNKTAPKRFHGLVPYLDPNVVGDSKHVWEPNRFGWAIWLGIAYRIMGDKKYADKFRQWTTDWFRCNPYPVGINYCSALELAYRNYAWLWSLSLFSDYLETEEELLDSLIQGIWIASRHVEENLSTYFAPNTHILGEAFGMFAVGAAIPEFRDSSRWRSKGLDLLQTESTKQFFQDGMHRELSSGYHIYSTDIYLHTVQIGRESGFRIPPRVEETAKRSAKRLAELVPEGLIMPQFNDCDGGQLIHLVQNPMDAGPTLSAAEAIFPEESFMPELTPRKGYSLLMTKSKNVPEQREPLRRAALECQIDRDLHRIYDSGLASYRSPDRDYILLRASEFGYLDCPHSHDAGLGVILHLRGTPIFVDSGVGSYTQSEACRNTFRSGAGKNTPLVNGKGPSTPDGWFSWKKTTDAELVSMKRFRDGFIARGKHAGFSDSPQHHTFVRREVILLDIGIIAIVDRWDSDSDVVVESRFTLSPQLELDLEHNVLRSVDGLTFDFCGMSLNAGGDLDIDHNEESYSPNYGLISKTSTIAHRHQESTRGGIVTFVSRCGPIRRTSDGNAQCRAGAIDIQFELSAGGVTVNSTSPIEQLN